jgi:hypothetical protein
MCVSVAAVTVWIVLGYRAKSREQAANPVTATAPEEGNR